MGSGTSGTFGGIDLTFFLGYMVVVMVIGFVAGKREQATVVDYFRAGNRLPWYAIGFSIIAAGISSEQFVGEMGYAYKLGMPVVNWEWLIFPALSILLWVFVPLYFRNRITTMPEYLENRYGPKSRTLYACLIVASYVFVNFALVFYTGGFALNELCGWNKIAAVWVLAITTGAYTIYGGLKAAMYTDAWQALVMLGSLVFLLAAVVWFLGGPAAAWQALFATNPLSPVEASAAGRLDWTRGPVPGLSLGGTALTGLGAGLGNPLENLPEIRVRGRGQAQGHPLVGRPLAQLIQPGPLHLPDLDPGLAACLVDAP